VTGKYAAMCKVYQGRCRTFLLSFASARETRHRAWQMEQLLRQPANYDQNQAAPAATATSIVPQFHRPDFQFMSFSPCGPPHQTPLQQLPTPEANGGYLSADHHQHQECVEPFGASKGFNAL
jgi:hypothetical protein